MNRLSAALLAGGMLSGAVLAATHHPAVAKPPLPILGTQLSVYPEGKGKLIADKGCLQCHSADIARQQRLTEKQWTSVVEKMIRWGSDVSPNDKADLISYLETHFGPANDRFRPVEVQPVGADTGPPR